MLVIIQNRCCSRVSISYFVHLPPDILSPHDSPKAGYKIICIDLRPCLIRLTDFAPHCWRKGIPPHLVELPTSGSAKRRSCRKMSERFCLASDPVCLVVHGPRANPNWRPLVSTREFQRSLLTRPAASSKSIPTTRRDLTAVHRKQCL